MSTNAPLKSIQDGLVFYFDANNPKSYVGEPTTNYLTYPLNVNSATKESFVGTITENSILAPDGTYTAASVDLTSGYFYETLTIPIGTNINYSVWIRTLDGTSTTSYGPYVWNYNNPTYGIVVRDLTGISPEWKRMTMTYLTLSHQSSFAISYGGNNGGMQGKYAIWRPQLEYKTRPTPFVVGTRSNTQGLRDLTKRTTIDLTNTKFDSNALLDFPINASANSYATTNTNCNLTGDQTLTAWIKPTFGSSTPHRTVICTDKDYQYGIKLMNYKNNSRWGIWLGWGSSNYEALTAGDINDNRWKMITGTWKQSTGIATLYLNGEYVTQFSTGNTSALSLSTGNIWIGMGYELSFGNGQSYEGKIDSAAIYNKTLSLDEIRQLYLRTKSRYGL